MAMIDSKYTTLASEYVATTTLAQLIRKMAMESSSKKEMMERKTHKTQKTRTRTHNS